MIGWSVGRSVGRSVGQSVSQSVSQSSCQSRLGAQMTRLVGTFSATICQTRGALGDECLRCLQRAALSCLATAVVAGCSIWQYV